MVYSSHEYHLNSTMVNDDLNSLFSFLFFQSKCLNFTGNDKKVVQNPYKCHSYQPFTTFHINLYTNNTYKLLAIYYVQVYHRIPTLVGALFFCIPYTATRKTK